MTRDPSRAERIAALLRHARAASDAGDRPDGRYGESGRLTSARILEAISMARGSRIRTESMNSSPVAAAGDGEPQGSH